MKSKPVPDAPAPCTIKGHDITRSFGEAKDGQALAECLCWTCEPIKCWVEIWKFDRVSQNKNEQPT